MNAFGRIGVKPSKPKIEFNSTIDYVGYQRQRTSSVSVSTPFDKALRIAEPIDNSRDAGASQVDVKLKSSLVEIRDNGDGIPKDILKKTLQKQGVQIKTANDKIGRYGFGMKDTAMLLGATTMEIVTNHNGAVWTASYEINSGRVTMAEIDHNAMPQSGTLVRYHLPTHEVGRDFFNKKTIDKIKKYLSQIYHPLNGKVKITVNGDTLSLDRTIAGRHLHTEKVVFGSDVFVFDFYFLEKYSGEIFNGIETVIDGERVLSFGGSLDNIYKVNPAKGRFKGILRVPTTMNIENLTPSVNKDRLIVSNKQLREVFDSVIENAYKMFVTEQQKEEQNRNSAIDNQITDILKSFLMKNVQFFGSGFPNIDKETKEAKEAKMSVEVEEKKVTNPHGNPDTLKQNLKKIKNINIQTLPLGEESEPYYFEYNAEQSMAGIVLNIDSAIYKMIKAHEKNGVFSDYYTMIAADFQEESSNLIEGKESPQHKQSWRNTLNQMASYQIPTKTQETRIQYNQEL